MIGLVDLHTESKSVQIVFIFIIIIYKFNLSTNSI